MCVYIQHCSQLQALKLEAVQEVDELQHIFVYCHSNLQIRHPSDPLELLFVFSLNKEFSISCHHLKASPSWQSCKCEMKAGINGIFSYASQCCNYFGFSGFQDFYEKTAFTQLMLELLRNGCHFPSLAVLCFSTEIAWTQI